MNENIFHYQYSAQENREIQEIRKKYLPQEENNFEELKRLDYTVQMSGIAESLCVGIGGTLVFGLGLCFAMQIIGSGIWSMIGGIILGLIGIAGMLAAYPVYLKVFRATKEKHTARILELAAKLTSF